MGNKRVKYVSLHNSVIFDVAWDDILDIDAAEIKRIFMQELLITIAQFCVTSEFKIQIIGEFGSPIVFVFAILWSAVLVLIFRKVVLKT